MQKRSNDSEVMTLPGDRTPLHLALLEFRNDNEASGQPDSHGDQSG